MNQYGSSYGTSSVMSGGGGPVQVQLQKMDPNQPWGFRLQGGRDFRQQLSVKKVTKGSPADGQLQAGDAILTIGSYDASQLTHMQARQIIQQTGGMLQLTLQKGQFRSIKPSGPVKFSPGAAYSHGY